MGLTLPAGLPQAPVRGQPGVEYRIRCVDLHSLKCLLEDNEGSIIAALKEDLRKGTAEAAISEVWDTLGQVVFMEQNLESFCRKEAIPTPIHQKPLSFEMWKEPFGVVTIVGPWNLPFGLMLTPLAGALAAGNVCVLKPSEISVASSRLLKELIAKYFDPSEVTVIAGGVEQTTALLAEKVDNIMYTGGGAVGRIVMAAAAKNLTPVTLELGGKCPVYIDESANIQVAARRLIFGKNVNCGQVCIAPDHVLVHEKVRDNTLSVANLYCLLLLRSSLPALSCIWVEEIFGPILPVISVKSVDEAISFCGSRPTPLAAYVFQCDSAVCTKWLTEVASGGACVNDCLLQIINSNGGLAGKGESGMGASRGRASFEAFSHRKVVCYQPANFDPLIKYPPFKGVPESLKLMVTGDFPVWVKPAFWSVVVAVASAVALLVSKHVSLNINLTFH
eukprot:jgi/Undpi1/22/HiC_scaffold_1.g00022.m1